MNSRSGPARAASTDDYKPEGTTLLALEPAALAHRIAPALVELGLARTISWSEARRVLDAVEFYSEIDARRYRAIWRLLGGQS